MSNQVQCPNCGGYKVSTEKQEAITETKSVPMSFGKALFYAIGGIVAWAILGLICSGILSSAIPMIIVGLVSLGIIVYAIPRAVAEAKKGTLSENKVNRVGTVYHLYCQLCGYRWAWDNRTPYPKVNVRPDLIEQGEQRLEEESRKAQENAAALYYLTHKK